MVDIDRQILTGELQKVPEPVSTEGPDCCFHGDESRQSGYWQGRLEDAKTQVEVFDTQSYEILVGERRVEIGRADPDESLHVGGPDRHRIDLETAYGRQIFGNRHSRRVRQLIENRLQPE